MTSIASEEVDVIVVGGGITGLMLSRNLGRLGYSVALLESRPRLAAGATTRNEGWLHHGTYHAASIANRAKAVAVAQRCLYGALQIRALAPEALEEPLTRSYAFTSQVSFQEEIEYRWARAGVAFRRIAPSELREAVPSLRTEDLAAAYDVADRAIDTRILCSVLIQDVLHLGVEIVTNARITQSEAGTIKVTVQGEAREFRGRIIAAASGYSLQALCRVLGLSAVPLLRFWKSHLIVTARITDSPTFSLDPGEAALMNHGSFAIIGLNEDARQVAQPDNSPEEEDIERIVKAVRFRLGVSISTPPIPVACTKVDVAMERGQPRSLAPMALPLGEGYYAVLPGKMTETPYVVDRAILRFANELGLGGVAARPCDTVPSTNAEWLGDIWSR